MLWQVRRLIVLGIFVALGCGRTFEITPAGDDAGDEDDSNDDEDEPDPLPPLGGFFVDDPGIIFMALTSETNLSCEDGFDLDCISDFRWLIVLQLQPGRDQPGRYQISSVPADFQFAAINSRGECEFAAGVADIGTLKLIALGETIQGSLIDVDIGGPEIINGTFEAQRCEI